MSEEIGLVYLNLSQLLDDICVFLRDGVNKEVFSADSQRKAETLIKRSKIQLQQISNITNGECYMEMEEQNQVEEVEEEEEELIYMDAEEEVKVTPVDDGVCPFAGQSVRDLPLDDKRGFIFMKTKFIFGFEKLKRVYAAIHKDWFLIYCNDKEAKPSYTYCLRLHKAQMVSTPKQGEHETQLFLLVNLETKQKWQFIAQTHKDMLQWITKINRYHQNDDRQPNEIKKMPKIEKVPEPEVSPKIESEQEDEEDTYDMVVLKVNDQTNTVQKEEEDEEIYEVIRPPSPDKNSHIPIPKPSEISTLPTRRQQTPLPPLPVDTRESSESLASYDNLVSVDSWEKTSRISETPSFSDEEEQEIYDVLIMTSQAEQESEFDKPAVPAVSPKKEQALSPLISSLKEKLLQSYPTQQVREKPIPPKKLSIDRGINISQNLGDSPRKENPSPVPSPIRKPLNSVSSNHSPTSPTSTGVFHKPGVQPKPQFLTKPKIDVKLIKTPANTKSSTKQVMKLAKEISLK